MYSLVALLRLSLLLVFVLIGLVAGLLSVFLPWSWFLKMAMLWHYCITAIVGVSCEISGASVERGALLVSNHVSWLDISVLGSKLPVIFLAKAEICQWPVLGWVVKKAGTLFIERGKGASKALTELQKALIEQQSVLIFPEGRTSDGVEVMRFQPRLFQSAIDANVCVQPIGICYQQKNGKRIDRIRYDGKIGFMESVWKTLCGPKFKAKVHVFKPFKNSADRDGLSKRAQLEVSRWIKNL